MGDGKSYVSRCPPDDWAGHGRELYEHQTPEERDEQLPKMEALRGETGIDGRWARAWLAARSRETAYRGSAR